MTAPRLAAGDLVAGKYSIRSHVRSDGTISTHFGADASGREVAIKLYSPTLGQRQDVLTALQTVHAKVSTLPVDLVVPVLDAGVDAERGNALFTVTERVALSPLPRLATAACTTVVRSMARALDAAHGKGLFHHALSPGNVLVDSESPRVVRLVDFGMNLARAAAPTQEGFAHAAPWMAPEQIDGRSPSAGADVFAVGLILFQALTGGSFWRSVSSTGFDSNRFQQEIRSQRGLASHRAAELQMTLPSSLDAFFTRALAVLPEQRFANVTELASAWEQALTSASIAPGPIRLAPAGTVDFKKTQYDDGAPIPPPPQNRFKSTQYVADPSRDLARPKPTSIPPAESSVAPSNAPPVAAAALAADPVPVASLPPSAPPPKSSSKAPLLIVLVLLVLGGGGAAAYFLLGPGATTAAKKTEPKKEGDKAKTDEASKEKTATDDDDPPAKKKAKQGDDDKPSGEQKPGDEKPDAVASSAGSEKPASSASAAPAEPPPKDAAEVTIQCNPACDSVTIDGKALTDPATPAHLAAGSHTVVASKAGYKSTTDTFTAKANTPTTRVYTLVLAPAPVAVTGPAAPKASASCGKFLKKCE